MRLLAVNSLAMAYWMPKPVQFWVLRAVGHQIGDAHLMSGSIIRCDTLTVGDGAFVNHRCFFDSGNVTLSPNVYIGPGVIFASADHEIGPPERRAGRNVHRNITVESGTWIGAGAVILSGVTIARGNVIAAGSVVRHDTRPDGVYAGVPATRKRDLLDHEEVLHIVASGR